MKKLIVVASLCALAVSLAYAASASAVLVGKCEIKKGTATFSKPEKPTEPAEISGTPKPLGFKFSSTETSCTGTEGGLPVTKTATVEAKGEGVLSCLVGASEGAVEVKGLLSATGHITLEGGAEEKFDLVFGAAAGVVPFDVLPIPLVSTVAGAGEVTFLLDKTSKEACVEKAVSEGPGSLGASSLTFTGQAVGTL